MAAIAQEGPSRRFQLKSGFLYNFTQFVEWPEAIFSSPGSPFVIGIIGENPFGSYLDAVVEGEEINGHPLIIRRYQNMEEIDTCHILYLNIPGTLRMEEVLKDVKGKHILTVSGAENFIQAGGMIQFITVNKKIRFLINPEAAKAANLKISSKLLNLAEIVLPEKN